VSDNDVERWLDSLGLGRYAEIFADNEIDWEVLPELIDEDLEKLGIPLGPRKKLLKAIARFSYATDEPTSATASALSVKPASKAKRETEAERRHLTVVFCDLVGSTMLSARLDPEEMREVICSYQNAVAGEIARFEGRVAKFMGDGVLAYFGWPRAHEDDAERAVRAGLAIVRAVAPLETPTKEGLAVRIGIATGIVVVGDLVGEGAAQEEAVVGETPNLAARLQEIAAAGTVLVKPRNSGPAWRSVRG
jgi:class 3 adenylate cyclase